MARREYDLGDVMMEDEFEDEFADDFEALRSLEDETPQRPLRRKLDFGKTDPSNSSAAPHTSTADRIHQANAPAAPCKSIAPRKRHPGRSLDADAEDDLDSLLGLISDEESERPAKIPRQTNRTSTSQPRPSDLVTAASSTVDERSPLLDSPPSPGITSSVRLEIQRFEEQRRYRGKVFRRPPLGEALPVTSTDGRYVYVSMRSEEQQKQKEDKIEEMWSGRKSHTQLLHVPFHQLLREVEQRRHEKAVVEADAALAALRESGDVDHFLAEESGDLLRPDVALAEGGASVGGRLWVDKYTPRSFTELLSDDGTNRTLLAWLKLWDGVVFGRKPGVLPQNTDPAKSITPGLEGLGERGRPKQKLALLCGPPGLGKTTLAHVIARHAGYNVIEINASDDRSPEVLKVRIETATQNHSVLGKDLRPTCLIVDEIDGAQAAAINVLMAACGPKKPTAAPPAATAGGRKKRQGASQGLSRPIICICNDQYVPALRPVRQQALVLTFQPTRASRLAARLHKISREEHLNADLTTLMALCEKAERDIRSCLNTLQFIHHQGRSLTIGTVQSVSIGQKDAHRSLFALWNAVFQLPKSKRQPVRTSDPNGQTNDHAGGPLSIPRRSKNVLDAAQSTGEHDRVRQGLFENYPAVKFKDHSMEAVTSSLEWLVFCDCLTQRINSTQDYTLMAYLPYLAVVFHLNFATPARPQLHYPHALVEYSTKVNRNQQLFESLLSDVPPAVRQHLGLCTAVMDVFHHLLEIISPFIRPVNTQLYNTKERQQLMTLIDNMISYNLTYRQERLPDGQFVFNLDPNVEELVRYPEMPQHKQITYAGKQLIAREIELERMRRLEAAITGITIRDGEKSSQTPSQQSQAAKTMVEEKPAVVKKKIAEVKQVSVDFFGRPIMVQKSTAAVEGGSSEDGGGDAISNTLWFRFNEGFSNAVRKPVKIQDLL